jgi:hypothetical protein
MCQLVSFFLADSHVLEQVILGEAQEPLVPEGSGFPEPSQPYTYFF